MANSVDTYQTEQPDLKEQSDLGLPFAQTYLSKS